jgi:hypothetical protein
MSRAYNCPRINLKEHRWHVLFTTVIWRRCWEHGLDMETISRSVQKGSIDCSVLPVLTNDQALLLCAKRGYINVHNNNIISIQLRRWLRPWDNLLWPCGLSYWHRRSPTLTKIKAYYSLTDDHCRPTITVKWKPWKICLHLDVYALSTPSLASFLSETNEN